MFLCLTEQTRSRGRLRSGLGRLYVYAAQPAEADEKRWIRARALIQIEAATCTGPRTAVNSTAASRKRSSVLRKSLYSGRYRAHGSGGRGRSAEAVSSADPLRPPSAHARARSRRCRLAAAQVPATKPPSSLQVPVRRNSSDGRENGQ